MYGSFLSTFFCLVDGNLNTPFMGRLHNVCYLLLSMLAAIIIPGIAFSKSCVKLRKSFTNCLSPSGGGILNRLVTSCS